MKNIKENSIELIHEKKSKKTLIVIILIAVALIVLIGLSIYNSKGVKINRSIDIFNQAVGWTEKYTESFIHDIGIEQEEIKNQLAKCAKKLSLDESYFEYTDNIYSEITVDFMDKYVQRYSFDDLIYGLTELKDDFGRLPYTDTDAKFFVVNDDFYNHFKDKFTDSSMYKLNSEGFYTENPDAPPQSWSKQNEVSGKFNNAADGNSVYSQTRTFTDTGRVFYYGDFAIEETMTHGYNKGQYGWRNGEFYDEPAHFTTKTFYTLYFKGRATSIDVDSSKLPKIKIYTSEDEESIYVIYESNDYSNVNTDEYEYHKRTGKIPMNITRIQ